MSGLIGVFSESQSAVEDLYYGLYAIQHRGQSAVGLATIDGEEEHVIRKKGLISTSFTFEDFNSLHGSIGIAHVKYQFHDEMNIEIMPLQIGDAFVCIDGKITNADFSYEELVEHIKTDGKELSTYISTLEGAFCILYADPEKMVAIRDTRGVKPLAIGKRGDVYLASSETCALEAVNAINYKDLIPGEIFTVTKEKTTSHYAEYHGHHLCLFEMIYIQRPDSVVEGVSVYKARYRSGELLARECPTTADVVIGAPDSGIAAALGYANASGIPYQPGLVKNRYVQRTFIEKTQAERDRGVRLKLNAVKEMVNGKDVILVDDSIVRGTTTRRTVEILRMSGARKVHIRIASPPVKQTESLSIDIPDKKMLIAYQKSIEEIREEIACDSLYYISIDGLREACGNKGYYERYFEEGE